MKKFHKVISFVLVFSFISFNILPAVAFAEEVDNTNSTEVQSVEQSNSQKEDKQDDKKKDDDHEGDHEDDDNSSKVNICHATNSQNNPWNAISISSNAVQSHLDHGDFNYAGPVKQNGTPANDGDAWCENNVQGDMCPNISGNQQTIPEGKELVNGQCVDIVVPVSQQCDFVSDTTNITQTNANAVETWTHSAWVNSTVLGTAAKWIWNAFHVINPSADETETFTKNFSVTGAVTSAALQIAADNGYLVQINGTTVVDKLAIEANYGSINGPIDVASYLIPGANTIKITVKNFGVSGSAFDSNPAGLLYKLSVTAGACSAIVPPPAPQVSTVTMCKTDDAQTPSPLSGWTLMLKGANVEDLSINSNNSLGTSTTNPLIAGASYIASAVGTWLNQGGANKVDAEYSTTDSWTTHMDGYTGYGSDILELQVDNKFDPLSNWGTYNSLHKYAHSFVPTGTSSNFRIFDGTSGIQNEGWFGDNSGSLAVNISKGYAGITGENGCTTFENVPYGTYTADEVMQDGWTNVSGLGEAVVNSPTETFSIVNHNTVVPPTPTGSIEITKYVCPNNFVPNRTNNGVGGVVPEGCNTASGVAFGYVHGTQTDANGPYPELDGSITSGGVTGEDGKLIIGPVSSDGRYLIKETNPADLLGLYCQGDGDTNPNNNDNQELTFVPANGIAKCVAYNKSNVLGETADSSTTVVTPSSMNGWNFYIDNAAGSTGSLVSGPGTAPLGSGSANLVVTANPQGELLATAYGATPLSKITTLKYSTYRTSGDPALAPSIQINIDKDSTDADLSWQGRLVYEPYYTQTVSTGAWQEWNGMDDAAGTGTGNWWFSNGTLATFTGCTQANPCTWAEVKTALPNGGIHATLGGIGFKAGSNWSSFDGNVDKFVLGVKTGLNTHTETYDFEPATPVIIDVCSNIEGNQSEIPSGYHLEGESNCIANTIPSDGGSGGGGGGGGGILPQGKVLGASTSCGIYVDKFLRRGYKNDVDAVKKLQKFLNDYMNAGIKEDGKFGLSTEKALKKFQQKHADKILSPWGFNAPTGIFYITTQTEVNNIMCEDLKLQLPALVPFEENPLAPKKED